MMSRLAIVALAAATLLLGQAPPVLAGIVPTPPPLPSPPPLPIPTPPTLAPPLPISVNPPPTAAGQLPVDPSLAGDAGGAGADGSAGASPADQLSAASQPPPAYGPPPDERAALPPEPERYDLEGQQAQLRSEEPSLDQQDGPQALAAGGGDGQFVWPMAFSRRPPITQRFGCTDVAGEPIPARTSAAEVLPPARSLARARRGVESASGPAVAARWAGLAGRASGSVQAGSASGPAGSAGAPARGCYRLMAAPRERSLTAPGSCARPCGHCSTELVADPFWARPRGPVSARALPAAAQRHPTGWSNRGPIARPPWPSGPERRLQLRRRRPIAPDAKAEREARSAPGGGGAGAPPGATAAALPARRRQAQTPASSPVRRSGCTCCSASAARMIFWAAARRVATVPRGIPSADAISCWVRSE